MSVDILMITWNRFDYAKRTIDNLLSSGDDFSLFWWDNGSTDGVADYIDGLDDKRICRKHRHESNVMQAIPTRWFLDNCTSDVVGKLDDDTLVPNGWVARIRDAIDQSSKAGMIGCWTFWPEDYERNANLAERKIKKIGTHKILWNISIGGTAFLMRRSLALNYLEKDHNGTAFPINREKMSVDGYLSGWYYPLLWSEHMDDPRSEYCMLKRGATGGVTALSAKVRGFASQNDFLDWIKSDADKILSTDTRKQIMSYRWRKSLFGRITNRFLKIVNNGVSK